MRHLRSGWLLPIVIAMSIAVMITGSTFGWSLFAFALTMPLELAYIPLAVMGWYLYTKSRSIPSRLLAVWATVPLLVLLISASITSASFMAAILQLALIATAVGRWRQGSIGPLLIWLMWGCLAVMSLSPLALTISRLEDQPAIMLVGLWAIAQLGFWVVVAISVFSSARRAPRALLLPATGVVISMVTSGFAAMGIRTAFGNWFIWMNLLAGLLTFGGIGLAMWLEWREAKG